MTTQSSNNPWFVVAMTLFGVIGGYVVATVVHVSGFGPLFPTGGAVAPAPIVQDEPIPAAAADVPEVDFDTDHIRGNKDAKIAVIEYSDYECPFCQRVHPTYEQLISERDDIMWVLRHFPLSFHPNAQKAAEASECANELGGEDAFWEISDMMFEQGADNTKLADYAAEIGLDADKFTECLDSGKYADEIAAEMAAGGAAGVTGTPGNIVLNIDTGKSQLVSGAQPIAAFNAAIDAVK